MSKSTKIKSSSGNAIGTLLGLAVVLILGIFYVSAGSDPFGLFASEATATKVNVSTFTPAPQQPATETVAAVSEAAATTDAPPVVTAKSWWEVGFVSPIRVRQADEEAYGENGLPPELLAGSLTEKLIQRIDSAQTSIHIASFETDIVDVARALIRARERGVDVRWITDDEYGLEKDGNPGHGQFKLMSEAGIEIKDDARGGLMHNKFWIFDSQTVWTGSTNITISGMFEQNNNLIVIESPELAAIYEMQFADMWGGLFGARSPSTVAEQSVTAQGTPIQVFFSPEDNAVQYIVPYLQNAQKSIYFMAFSYTQPNLGEAMLDRLANGIPVQGVFETVGSDTEYSEMKILFCAGGKMRQDGNFAFMHHKVIIVDERFVITGSLNFSDSANKQNNENVIILDNPDIAKLYVEEFWRVWQAGADLDPNKFPCK
jgi:phosphatidylserine/phosphatidylglycerophosphate/cardiolipin synthase-like enzyme